MEAAVPGGAGELAVRALVTAMGTLYIALPSDQRLREWFGELDLEVPDTSDGRLPTEQEIRTAIARLQGYEVDYSRSNDVTVAEISWAADPSRGPWASLVFRDPSNDPAKRCLTFRKGWPEVMVLLLHALSQLAGPLVLIPDSGSDPLLVHPAADPQELQQHWDG